MPTRFYAPSLTWNAGSSSWRASPEPRAAGDLADLSELSLPAVSEHLKVLRKVGLVVVQREGRFWYYRADPNRLADIIATLETMKGPDDGT